MSAKTTAGDRFFIGTTKTCVTAADYAGDTWTEVKNIADLGDRGDTFDEVKVSSIGNPRTAYVKGLVDGGNNSITVNRDIADPGQLAMLAAVPIRSNYNFKLLGTDGDADYYAGPVMSSETKRGGPNNLVQIVFKIAISTDTVIVLPGA